MKSVMTNRFKQSADIQMQRSSFDRSHGHKKTMEAGFLYPILCDEALPGDTFNLQATALARLATPIFPVMDNMTISTFFFFIPNRLLWVNWEKFMGAQDNPGDSIDYIVPTLQYPAGGFQTGDLADNMGLPTNITTALTINAWWHRGYNLVWNEWFRDQNLQNSIVLYDGDGPDPYVEYYMRRRGKRHDYFTSCLPAPQRGPEVLLPLGMTAPVVGIAGAGPKYLTTDTDPMVYGINQEALLSSTAVHWGGPANPTAAAKGLMWGQSGLEVDLTAATAASINQIREAVAIQNLLERDARGGTRYVEILKSHFQVTSPDFRLQRPEYLGGGNTPLRITPVPQTSGTDVTSPQGNLAGYGTAEVRNNGFTGSFTEHGIILGLMSISADLNYQQGIEKQFSRQTRYDYYWPEFANIGEQSVLNKEIWADGTGTDDLTFGYQERYAEYRFKSSQITGQFRSNATGGTLDAWHLAQNFASRPVLNAGFIEDNPPINRIVAVPSEPKFLVDVHFQLRCARPMPLYSIPGMGNKF